MKIFALLMTLAAFSASANECAQDAKKFCSSVEPGKGQLAKCLSDYENQLSKECATELRDFKKTTAKKNACFEDLAELCAEIPTDPQKLEYCLLKHESKLSDNCSKDFKSKKGNIIVKNVCAQDIVNICYSSLTGPDGSISRCLIKNKDKLSGFCKKNMETRIVELRKNNPCFDDTEKLCPTQVKFMDIQECLEKKMKTLAPNCKLLVEHELKKAAANPCYKDLMKHCRPGISPQDQHRCLTINEKELSNACQQFRVKDEERIKKLVDLCEPDRLKHCPKAPFQNGAVAKCLMENKKKLTKQCADLL